MEEQLKPFLIRCPRCQWGLATRGIKEELEELVEIPPKCKTCGGWRKFRCPKCNTPAPMKRIRGNT